MSATDDGPADARVARLEARVVELEARLAILGLEGTYARAWDTGDADGWAGVFTDDGVFALEPVGGEPGRRVSGRGELVAFCREFTGRVTGMHLLNLPELTVDGDTASGHLHFRFESVLREQPDLTQHADVTGSYDVTYVRTAAGWRIRERVERAVRRARSVFYTV